MRDADGIREALTEEEQDRIYMDLQRPLKIDHWMWWGFPLSKEDVPDKASQRTLQYAITQAECIILLSSPWFVEYYRRALRILVAKHCGRLDLYFSKVDQEKFWKHARFFRQTCVLLHIQDIIMLLDTLLQEQVLQEQDQTIHTI